MEKRVRRDGTMRILVNYLSAGRSALVTRVRFYAEKRDASGVGKKSSTVSLNFSHVEERIKLVEVLDDET